MLLGAGELPHGFAIDTCPPNHNNEVFLLHILDVSRPPTHAVHYRRLGETWAGQGFTDSRLSIGGGRFLESFSNCFPCRSAADPFPSHKQLRRLKALNTDCVREIRSWCDASK